MSRNGFNQPYWKWAHCADHSSTTAKMSMCKNAVSLWICVSRTIRRQSQHQQQWGRRRRRWEYLRTPTAQTICWSRWRRTMANRQCLSRGKVDCETNMHGIELNAISSKEHRYEYYYGYAVAGCCSYWSGSTTAKYVRKYVCALMNQQEKVQSYFWCIYKHWMSWPYSSIRFIKIDGKGFLCGGGDTTRIVVRLESVFFVDKIWCLNPLAGIRAIDGGYMEIFIIELCESESVQKADDDLVQCMLGIFRS